MKAGEQDVKASTEIRDALRTLTRPPFFTILLLEIVLGVVAGSIGELIGADPAAELEYLAAAASVFFAGATFYLQIATILAAGGRGEPNADAWIRAAIRHRCFWRFVATSFVTILLILLGAVAFIVGAIAVASALALSQPAVVLERLRPSDALRRSTELTVPARRVVGIVFAVFWLPQIVESVVLLIADIELTFLAEAALGVANSVLAAAATIAVTRLFVKLGGAPTPPLQTLLYKPRAG